MKDLTDRFRVAKTISFPLSHSFSLSLSLPVLFTDLASAVKGKRNQTFSSFFLMMMPGKLLLHVQHLLSQLLPFSILCFVKNSHFFLLTKSFCSYSGKPRNRKKVNKNVWPPKIQLSSFEGRGYRTSASTLFFSPVQKNLSVRIKLLHTSTKIRNRFEPKLLLPVTGQKKSSLSFSLLANRKLLGLDRVRSQNRF